MSMNALRRNFLFIVIMAVMIGGLALPAHAQ